MPLRSQVKSVQVERAGQSIQVGLAVIMLENLTGTQVWEVEGAKRSGERVKVRTEGMNVRIIGVDFNEWAPEISKQRNSVIRVVF